MLVYACSMEKQLYNKGIAYMGDFCLLVSCVLQDIFSPAGYVQLRFDPFGSRGARTHSEPGLIASGLVLFQHVTALCVNIFIPPVNPNGCILRTNTRNTAVLCGCAAH